MYSYIKGRLTELHPTHAVVETTGIGFHIFIPLTTYSTLSGDLEQEIQLHLAYVVREDAHILYGFIEPSERDLFNRVRDVSGIGPKTALSLIGHMDSQTLEWAIAKQDDSTISKVPGIGKKTAQRLIVELQGKLTPTLPKTPNAMSHDATSALIQLGYSLDKSQKAVAHALKNMQDHPDLSTLITSALQYV